MLESLLISGTKVPTEKDHSARPWVSDLSFSPPHRLQYRRKHKQIWASWPGSLIWGNEQLMDILPESWSICQTHWARLWVLILIFSLQKEFMLTGNIAIAQPLPLNCQGKTGRAEGRGMPYKNYNGGQRSKTRSN